jgi:hypothetical protein
VGESADADDKGQTIRIKERMEKRITPFFCIFFSCMRLLDTAVFCTPELENVSLWSREMVSSISVVHSANDAKRCHRAKRIDLFHLSEKPAGTIA